MESHCTPARRGPRLLVGTAVATAALSALAALAAGPAAASTAGQAAQAGQETLTQEWGTATVTVEPYFIGGVEIAATITDTKSDSRCVYVDYKINATRWFDGFDKLTRVCGNGDSDGNTVTWVGPSWSSAHSVEVRICREQGLGRDSCGPISVLPV